jgi:DNA primase catalytic subunit
MLDKSLVRKYYRELFVPISDHLVGLATLGGAQDIYLREIEYTKGNGTRFDRNRRTAHAQGFRDILAREAPASVYLGGCFPESHRDSRKQLRALRNEISIKNYFVIDIDITDYHDVRAQGICGCGTHELCDVCWDAFMEPARRVLHFLLSEIMGFKSIVHVFSGRRGFHIWTLDRRVHDLTNPQRELLVNRFGAIRENDAHYATRSCNFFRQEPAYVGIVKILEPYFEKYFVNNPRFNLGTRYAEKKLLMNPIEFKNMYEFDMLRILMPRFDKNVTTDSTHLTRMPMSIHSKTGYIVRIIPYHVPFIPSKGIVRAQEATPTQMQQDVVPLIDALRHL